MGRWQLTRSNQMHLYWQAVNSISQTRAQWSIVCWAWFHHHHPSLRLVFFCFVRYVTFPICWDISYTPCRCAVSDTCMSCFKYNSEELSQRVELYRQTEVSVLPFHAINGWNYDMEWFLTEIVFYNILLDSAFGPFHVLFDLLNVNSQGCSGLSAAI